MTPLSKLPDLLAARLSARPRLALGEETSPRAAVAAVLREAPAGHEILFLRRADDPRDPWSGHVAFPGGRRDADDADLLATALRETLEEIGLDLSSHGRLLGPLDDLHAVARARRTGLVISPFVFALHREPPFSLSDEIAAYRWSPLEPLLRGESRTSFAYEHEGNRYDLPAVDAQGWVVWGLTHQMLQMLMTEIRLALG